MEYTKVKIAKLRHNDYAESLSEVISARQTIARMEIREPFKTNLCSALLRAERGLKRVVIYSENRKQKPDRTRVSGTGNTLKKDSNGKAVKKDSADNGTAGAVTA